MITGGSRHSGAAHLPVAKAAAARDRAGLTSEGPTARIRALTEGEDDEILLMATLACEWIQSDNRFDELGFYRLTAPEAFRFQPEAWFIARAR